MQQHRLTCRAITLALLGLLTVPAAAAAQNSGRYFPLNQSTLPGVMSRWHSLSAGTVIGAPQPVRVEVGGGGTVSFYDQSATAVEHQPSPAQARLAVGHVYRLRISGLPDFPNVELYPSVEILDQLHPPQGMEDRYPVPVVITQEEIKAVLKGRMLTKVVYLESPRKAEGRARSLPDATDTLPNTQNLLAEADRLGRPMALLRLGSRVPGPGSNSAFFGTGGPVGPSLLNAAPAGLLPQTPGNLPGAPAQPAGSEKAPQAQAPTARLFPNNPPGRVRLTAGSKVKPRP